MAFQSLITQGAEKHSLLDSYCGVTYWFFCSRSWIFNIVRYLLKVGLCQSAELELNIFISAVHLRTQKGLIVGFLSRHNPSEFVKPVSSKGLTIDDIHLPPDDLEMYIDLSPFLNPSHYVVPEDMSLTKVYNLFRQLGLRHLLVVPRVSRVVGMITRKDLLIEDTEDSAGVKLQSTSDQQDGNEFLGGNRMLSNHYLVV